MRIVVYYRHAPAEPEASQAALAEQRAAVADYVRDNEAVVVGEFTEEASGSTGPEFDAACRACAKLGAQLVVASLQAIGSGEPLRSMSFPATMDPDLSKASEFLPPIEPVVLGPPISEPAGRIPVPADAPRGLLLHATNAEYSYSAIYLCNNGETDVENLSIFDVELDGVPLDGLSCSRGGGDEWETRIDCVRKGTCILFGLWHSWNDAVRAYCLFRGNEEAGTVERTSYICPSRFMPFRTVNLVEQDRSGGRSPRGETPPANAVYSTAAIELDEFLTFRLPLDELGDESPLLARIGVLHGRVFDSGPPSLGMVVDGRVTRLVSIDAPVRVLEGTAMNEADLAGLAAIIDRLRAPLRDCWFGRLTSRAFRQAVEAAP